MHHCDDACAVAINAAMQSLAKMPQIKKDSFKKKAFMEERPDWPQVAVLSQ